MSIRIFVYDDHQERRDSLKALIGLYNGFEFVGGAPHCGNVLNDIEQYYPDIVLMDINMPHVDGLEGLKLIKQHFPYVNVLIQTVFDDNEKIFTSLRYGASGYILKSDQPQKIFQAIEEVYHGGAAMNPGIARKVLEYFIPVAVESPLSNKETAVLQLLAEGLSYKMIAGKLDISYTTVNSHIKHIYQKLHISSLGEAIAYYYKHLKTQDSL